MREQDEMQRALQVIRRGRALRAVAWAVVGALAYYVITQHVLSPRAWL